MAWQIKFVTNEATGVSVILNGKLWVRHSANGMGLTWDSSEGTVTHDVPAEFSTIKQIRVVAAASPHKKNASIRILWDGDQKKEMNFDDHEDGNVDHD